MLGPDLLPLEADLPSVLGDSGLELTRRAGRAADGPPRRPRLDTPDGAPRVLWLEPRQEGLGTEILYLEKGVPSSFEIARSARRFRLEVRGGR
ncbi:MAG: hypothetical protein AAF725_00515 [Acidobacteriota bacterium]